MKQLSPRAPFPGPPPRPGDFLEWVEDGWGQATKLNAARDAEIDARKEIWNDWGLAFCRLAPIEELQALWDRFEWSERLDAVPIAKLEERPL